MEVYLSSLGYDAWMLVKNGYTSPTIPPTKFEAKREYECNVEAKKVMLSRLSNAVSSKVKKCKSAKNVWDRLKNIYGEEPTTFGSNCGSKKIKEADKCADDKIRYVSCCSRDGEETRLFMEKEVQSENKTSKVIIKLNPKCKMYLVVIKKVKRKLKLR